MGGTTLIKLGKGALLPNDEGYKMAVTDALGTALKMLGVAADIYMGKFDGSKYVDEVQAKTPPRKGTGNPAYNRPPDGAAMDGTPKTAIAEFNDMLAAAGISVNDGNKYKSEVAKDAKIEEWQVLSRALENKNGFCTAIKAWLEERKEWREPGSDDE